MTVPFESLPLKPEYPQYATWGLYGEGKEKELGQLNLLTPEVVQDAAKLIQSGKRVSLDAPVDYLNPLAFGRLSPEHEIVPLAGGQAYDDVLKCNTQGSTQWDGFRHFPTKDGRFYNGVTGKEITTPKSLANSIHYWQEQGIVGRGVFLNFYSWAQENLSDYDPLSSYSVQLKDLLACAKAQNVTFKKADILVIRFGFADRYQHAPKEKREALAEHMTSAGLAQSEDVLKWIWEQQFSAMASDAPALEMTPGTPEKDPDAHGLLLHTVLLGCWGMPIGELFHLEDLAKLLKEQNRSAFFFTSQVNHVRGGVASSPNALAIT